MKKIIIFLMMILVLVGLVSAAPINYARDSYGSTATSNKGTCVGSPSLVIDGQTTFSSFSNTFQSSGLPTITIDLGQPRTISEANFIGYDRDISRGWYYLTSHRWDAFVSGSWVTVASYSSGGSGYVNRMDTFEPTTAQQWRFVVLGSRWGDPVILELELYGNEGPNCSDDDGDGFGAEGTNISVCSGSSTLYDCDDSDDSINPAATDIPGNSVDEDCSGEDAPLVCYDLSSYDSVIYVDDDGNDATGDGSESAPYATIRKGSDVASADNGNSVALVIMPGVYEPELVIDSNLGNQISNALFSAIDFDIIGFGRATEIHVKNSNHQVSSRGYHLFFDVYGIDVYRLYIKWWADGYRSQQFAGADHAMFSFADVDFHNVAVEVMDAYPEVSYSWYNNGAADRFGAYNSVFKLYGSYPGDYNGDPHYENCLFSVTPQKGGKVSSITRTVTSSDFESATGDLIDGGTGFDPDGSQANIGVYGGACSWDYIASSGCTDADGDGFGALGTNLSECNYTVDYDCDDSDVAINPLAVDIPNNGVDEDCSGADATANYDASIAFTYDYNVDGFWGYHVGDDVGYEITFKKDDVAHNADVVNIVANLSDVEGNTLLSHSLSDMTQTGTGAWSGVFDTTSLSTLQDDKINLRVYVYGVGGSLLDWAPHQDQVWVSGTSANESISAGSFIVETSAPSNKTVRDLVVRKNSFGKLNFTRGLGDALDLSSRVIPFDSAVVMGSKFLSVDSASYPELNKSSLVSIENVDCSGFDRAQLVYYEGYATDISAIQANGETCPGSICSDVLCSGSTLSFSVAHFSGFAAGANSNLTINDSAEGSYVENDTSATFYAYYVNATSGALISGASCTVDFDDGSGPQSMSEGASYYSFTKSAGFSSATTHDWNVTCSKSGFTDLNTEDTILVIDPTAAVSVPEFSTWTLLIGLMVVIGGFLAIRRQE